MDSAVIIAIISTFLGAGGLLGGMGWLFRNLLKNKDDQLERIRAERDEKAKECEEERERADAWQEKYVNVLIADIEERKSKDRTFDLLARAAGSQENRREE